MAVRKNWRGEDASNGVGDKEAASSTAKDEAGDKISELLSPNSTSTARKPQAKVRDTYAWTPGVAPMSLWMAEMDGLDQLGSRSLPLNPSQSPMIGGSAAGSSRLVPLHRGGLSPGPMTRLMGVGRRSAPNTPFMQGPMDGTGDMFHDGQWADDIPELPRGSSPYLVANHMLRMQGFDPATAAPEMMRLMNQINNQDFGPDMRNSIPRHPGANPFAHHHHHHHHFGHHHHHHHHHNHHHMPPDE
ncbi:hypothetical protein DIPPA_60435, partial [Diplonema papillatum]